MKSSAIAIFALLSLLIVISCSFQCIQARGGRRGGGSFGGIFGGWRKYKKPSSTSNSRRTTSGSPMHTAASKPVNNGNTNGGMMSSASQTKSQASYPKQAIPSASNGYNYAHGSSPASGVYVPPGGTYYTNTAAMPPGAIYYAQPPMYASSSSGNHDFLFGMMAGHMLFGNHRTHVTHVYGQTPNQGSNDKVIIINNGEDMNKTAQDDGYKITVPLAPLNPMNFTNEKDTSQQHTQTAQIPTSANGENAQQTQPPPSTGGIICMPMIFNQTDPNESNKTIQIERIVCYPAPPPAAAPLPSPINESSNGDDANANCVVRTFAERDPNDPMRTIEVQKEICFNSSTSEPPQIAGEIGETTSTSTTKKPTSNFYW